MASSNQGNKQSGTPGSSQSAGGTRNRGFASMDPARQREIASQGGKAAHAREPPTNSRPKKRAALVA